MGTRRRRRKRHHEIHAPRRFSQIEPPPPPFTATLRALNDAMSSRHAQTHFQSLDACQTSIYAAQPVRVFFFCCRCGARLCCCRCGAARFLWLSSPGAHFVFLLSLRGAFFWLSLRSPALFFVLSLRFCKKTPGTATTAIKHRAHATTAKKSAPQRQQK